MASCDSCAQFARNMQQFEGALKGAVDVKVPEGLASRILLRQSTGDVQNRHQQRNMLFAIAASVVLSVSVTLGLVKLNQVESPQSMDQLVLAHLQGEMGHLQEDGNYSLAQVREKIGGLNASISGDIGLVKFASKCDIHDKPGGHIVLKGDKGSVTVLIMPSETIAKRFRVKDKRFNGVVVPMNTGSMAIIGERGEKIQDVEKRLRKYITII